VTGSELRQRRERLDLSQAQLARALDTSPNTVARWERGEMQIRMPGVLRFILTEMERDRGRFPLLDEWTAYAETWLTRNDQ
jgi:transcriptional regulator with XRE-family HTH domain